MSTERSGRALVLMGSGETSPTMVTAHQETLRAAGGPAVILDTTFGFQENADELAARIVDYFSQSVGVVPEVVSLRNAQLPNSEIAAAIAAVRGAKWVFAGPGSPTYAARIWREVGLTPALNRVLEQGAVVLASAAALSAGTRTAAIYEIYKVGQEPHWVPGMDLLGSVTGLKAAVIPHFDNMEGGSHDTRYCYMGERRLALMENLLDDDEFILGIDEHTGIRIDIEAQDISVFGKGSLTIRMGGKSWVVPSGETVTVAAVAEQAGTRLREVVTEDAIAFSDLNVDELLDQGRIEEAVRALIELDRVDRDIDTRATLHALMVRLGQIAAAPRVDLAAVIAPFVEALLQARQVARASGSWDQADSIRNTLANLHIRVEDGPDGSKWSIE